jgi:hypothetical protein
MFFIEMEKQGYEFKDMKDLGKIMEEKGDVYFLKDNIMGSNSNFYHTDFVQEERMKKIAVNYIKQNIPEYLSLVWNNAIGLNTENMDEWYAMFFVKKSDPQFIKIYNFIHKIGRVLLFSLFCSFLIFAWKLRSDEHIILIIGMVVYFTIVTSMVVYGYTRYRLLIIPFYTLFLAYFVYKVLNIIPNHYNKK